TVVAAARRTQGCRKPMGGRRTRGQQGQDNRSSKCFEHDAHLKQETDATLWRWSHLACMPPWHDSPTCTDRIFYRAVKKKQSQAKSIAWLCFWMHMRASGYVAGLSTRRGPRPCRVVDRGALLLAHHFAGLCRGGLQGRRRRLK